MRRGIYDITGLSKPKPLSSKPRYASEHANQEERRALTFNRDEQQDSKAAPQDVKEYLEMKDSNTYHAKSPAHNRPKTQP